MDSLLANYASSDEEEQQQQRHHTAFPLKLIEPSSSSSSKVSSVFSSFPQPRSSSLFSSLPQPKQAPKTPNIPIHEDNKEEENSLKPTYATKSSSIFSSLPQLTQTFQNPKIPGNNKEENSKPSSKPNPSSIFSSLPQPKSEKPISKVSSLDPTPKRVVQFKPPINLPPVKSRNFDDDEDDDDDDEEKERKRRKQLESSVQNSTVKSFLSNIPAPKNSATLGVLPSLGSGRRSIIETETPELKPASSRADNESGIDQNAVNYANYESSDNQNAENYVHYEQGRDHNAVNYVNYGTGIDQYSANYSNYGGYDQNIGVSVDASNYGIYESYGDQYGNNCGDGSATMTLPDPVEVVQSVVRVPGKRGRNEIPKEIVEVKQDELMKNRPREDQVKLTGIAFGPSYQPASTKGKPSKLHKRKHQITSLFYDMKQKEMELAERRSRGFLTKAETQAKYGW